LDIGVGAGQRDPLLYNSSFAQQFFYFFSSFNSSKCMRLGERTVNKNGTL
jgi:hypothetical protein